MSNTYISQCSKEKFMKVNIKLFSGAIIRAGSFIRINEVAEKKLF